MCGDVSVRKINTCTGVTSV